jgi:hypothetical protein
VEGMNEHWRTCHINGCSGLLCGQVRPEPEPNWRSMYEAREDYHKELIEEKNKNICQLLDDYNRVWNRMHFLEEKIRVFGLETLGE